MSQKAKNTTGKQSLSGTQKAMIAVALSMVVLRKRNKKIIDPAKADANRDRPLTRADEAIIEELRRSASLVKVLPMKYAEKSNDVLTAIVLFDIATFLWSTVTNADNAYAQEILVNLNAEAQGIIHDSVESDLKAHIKQRALQKTFGSNVQQFHVILCVFWELGSGPLLFLEALIEVLGEICKLDSVPANLSNAEVLNRVNMIV